MKQHSVYICQQCNYQSPSFLGKCPECGEWNSLVETEVSATISNEKFQISNSSLESQLIRLSSVTKESIERVSAGIGEFDRVLGGGIVSGSIVLISGDPGIGKSTLLLHCAMAIAGETKSHRAKETKNKKVSVSSGSPATSGSVLYVTGEESAQQVKLRANRIVGLTGSQDTRISEEKRPSNLKTKIPENLYILPQTDVDTVLAAADKLEPKLLIIDSIQTLSSERLTGTAGSVGQVRECAQVIQRYAKRSKVPVFIVGHVTKEGTIAGPRTLEHLVDAVLNLEGDEQHAFRVLRSIKNRFGSTSEVGVFEMQETGMIEVANPSEMFLSSRIGARAGSVVCPTIAGGRPILAEVQALCTSTMYGVPIRRVTGLDYSRCQIVLAALSRVAKLTFGNLDVYINVAGGLKITEPAADLAVALSIASASLDKPLKEGVCAFGEVGLLGELRQVSFGKNRVAEAKRLGFGRFITPERYKTLEEAIRVGVYRG